MTTNSSWRVVMICEAPGFVPMIEKILAERGHKLVGIVGSPGPRSRRTEGYLAVAQQARPGLDVVISNHPNRLADMIQPMRPDLLWCTSFNWKIPGAVLDIPRLGTLNGHDSLLPKYRGRNASGWALRNDEPEIGVSVHYMSDDFDTGPVLAQRPIPVTDDDHNAAPLFAKFLAATRETFIEAIERLEAGDPGIPQDESKATYAGGAFEPEWREIDWTDTARHNFVKVRSWTGVRDNPLGAFGVIDGRRLLITATRLTYEQSTSAPPGTILDRRDDGALLIQCGDRPLEILEWSEVV